jgi:hypothetical protein
VLLALQLLSLVIGGIGKAVSILKTGKARAISLASSSRQSGGAERRVWLLHLVIFPTWCAPQLGAGAFG